MWRALIGQGDRAAVIGLTLCLGLDQHLQAFRDPVDDAVLPCDHLGEVVGDAAEMCHGFLECEKPWLCLLVHIVSFR